MLQDGRRHTPAQVVRVGAHRLDLAGPVSELLERPDAGYGLAAPGVPHSHPRCFQAGEVQGEHMPRWLVGVHARQVQRQQVAARLTGEVILADHGRYHWQAPRFHHLHALRHQALQTSMYACGPRKYEDS